MFQPFESAAQFYPGLILWCDPNSNYHDMEISTHPHNPQYDRKKAELRPCLVVSVDQTSQSIQVARFCATTPSDTRRWVRVDTPPRITWKLNDAWIWVGTPHTVAMVLNNNKVMHPHKDSYYAAPPVAAANLQNYWVHRQSYLMRESNTSTYPNTSTYNPTIRTRSFPCTPHHRKLKEPAATPACIPATQHIHPRTSALSP
ncbi:hypothetical protein C8R44DRAFT_856881, partial [Mycena epipterygia]